MPVAGFGPSGSLFTASTKTKDSRQKNFATASDSAAKRHTKAGRSRKGRRRDSSASLEEQSRGLLEGTGQTSHRAVEGRPRSDISVPDQFVPAGDCATEEESLGDLSSYYQSNNPFASPPPPRSVRPKSDSPLSSKRSESSPKSRSPKSRSTKAEKRNKSRGTALKQADESDGGVASITEKNSPVVAIANHPSEPSAFGPSREAKKESCPVLEPSIGLGEKDKQTMSVKISSSSFVNGLAAEVPAAKGTAAASSANAHAPIRPKNAVIDSLTAPSNPPPRRRSSAAGLGPLPPSAAVYVATGSVSAPSTSTPLRISKSSQHFTFSPRIAGGSSRHTSPKGAVDSRFLKPTVGNVLSRTARALVSPRGLRTTQSNTLAGPPGLATGLLLRTGEKSESFSDLISAQGTPLPTPTPPSMPKGDKDVELPPVYAITTIPPVGLFSTPTTATTAMENDLPLLLESSSSDKVGAVAAGPRKSGGTGGGNIGEVCLTRATFEVTQVSNSFNDPSSPTERPEGPPRPGRRSLCVIPSNQSSGFQPLDRRSVVSAGTEIDSRRASAATAGSLLTHDLSILHGVAPGDERGVSTTIERALVGSNVPGLSTHSIFNEPQDTFTTRNYRKWRSMKARNLQNFYRDHRQTFLRRMRRGIPQRFRWEAWKQAVELPAIMEATDLTPVIGLVPIRMDTECTTSPPAATVPLLESRGFAAAKSRGTPCHIETPTKPDSDLDDEFSLDNLTKMKDTMTPIRLYERLRDKTSKFASLIDIDIPRTFPEVTLFNKTAQESLRNVLNAYANFAPHVGYCQGMNFVMGFIQLVSDFGNEAECFWFFCVMMSKYNLHGFFREKFPLLGAYVQTFDQLAEYYAPELRKHFQKEQVLPPVYLHPWYLTVFVTSLPLGTVVVLWDFIICMGLHALLPVTLALLKVLQSFLLRLRFEGIVKFLKSLRSSGDCDESKIGKMLVKQAEHYPVLDRFRTIVVDVDFQELLMATGATDALRSSEKLVDFDSLGQPGGDNPLNAALADQGDLLDDEDDEDNGATTTAEMPTPSDEGRSKLRLRGEESRAVEGRRTSLPLPRTSPSASETSAAGHRPARAIRFLPKMIGRSSNK